MRQSTRAPWRSPLVALALALLFIAFKIIDPIKVDKALDNLTRRGVGWTLAKYYNSDWADLPPASVAVGLFEDSFKRDVSKAAPTLHDYAEIIRKLVEFGASEIVIDMNMRLEPRAQAYQEDIVAALQHAQAAKVPVVVPLLPDEEQSCGSDEEHPHLAASQLVGCAATARGAVYYATEDPTSYYPLYISFGDDEVLHPSLAMAAYYAYLDLSPVSTGSIYSRNPLLDDIFPAWRAPDVSGGYVFCSFSVRQLLVKDVIGDSTCPRKVESGEDEAKGPISIQSLVRKKIVLIGQAGRDNQDWIEVPVAASQPGVMLHATVLDNLLNFGGTHYPVSRDDLCRRCRSVLGWDLRMSQVYLLICCLLPPALRMAGRAMAGIRLTGKMGERIESHPILLGGLISFCFILVAPESLSTINAGVVFVSAYFILCLASLVETLIDYAMEHGYA